MDRNISVGIENIGENINTETTVTVEKRNHKVVCFNCLGNHHVKHCRERYDPDKVETNRKSFQQQNSRYYECQQMSGGLKPGVISNELKKALGLKPSQLPPYIYKMRILGYPPGWREKAIYESTDITIYSGDEEDLLEQNQSSPEEEIYDGTKFIEYPGFNSPVPSGCIDESEDLHMPPLQAQQQLAEALKSPCVVTTISEFNKRKLEKEFNGVTKKLKLEDEDYKSNLSENEEIKDCHEQQIICSQNKSESPMPKSSSEPSTSKTSALEMRSSSSTYLGTPIISHGNQYTKLPDLKNFSQGITEHLPFENLPDSVGAYEKMRKVMNKIRAHFSNYCAS